MPAVHLEDLTFTWSDAAPILEGVTLSLGPGATGVVGESGAGKTTLLRLVAGVLAPERGRVRLEPVRARLATLPQDVDAPGAAALALAAREDGEARRLRAALALAAGDLGRWPTLSPGERRRWQVGGALAAEPEVLLLDEPTNHADAPARARLAAALRAFRGVALVVSHDRALLDAVTARTLRLARGGARLWPFPYGAARAAWEAEEAAARAARAEASARVRRAEARLDGARRVHAAAAAGRSNRRADPKDRDARSIGARTVAEWAEASHARTLARRRGELARAREAVPEAPAGKVLGRSVFAGFAPSPRPLVLALDEAEVRAGGPGGARDGPPVLRDVHVRLGRADKVWLSGPNGAGKSTLLEALRTRGALPPDRMLHLPQELPPGAGEALHAEVRAAPPDERGRVLSLVAALGTDPDRLLASRAPSPGEARKLALALGLGRHAWALLLDEPTNHLDLPTVERLEEALAAWPGALLLVTHDEPLAARVTTARWRVASGRIEVG
jgi:ATPase subunit of ABC transporter with duplicated ATPase domains